MSLSRKKLIKSLFITPSKKCASIKFVEVNKPSSFNKGEAACMSSCSGNCQS
ncbi:hypothetical protein Psal006b_00583 [Piscirickettsia salmonis]|uniref:Uncharacterized protein n=1 Tax=Piscirickettsia salmonis TaxID=1238 RepID=A0AAC8VJU8_PISSA|nr:hypothetical protein KU39_2609 [Piscirickettsia salmonis]QGN97628.1 hypothetical protein Psal006b_00583 [Piscirickettsia salmonis]QGO01221.1 hypothetical protein Psal008_00581 [Piscirickettsia salmonis]QGO11946.1 hypothetical protein Psal010b_00582 [Piscirickettsia salmonis]QGO18963.1 hypothetical protein Psal013_00577 [Piscirickettsia salmonis]